jgi:hypothetical protein
MNNNSPDPSPSPEAFSGLILKTVRESRNAYDIETPKEFADTVASLRLPPGVSEAVLALLKFAGANGEVRRERNEATIGVGDDHAAGMGVCLQLYSF